MPSASRAVAFYGFPDPKPGRRARDRASVPRVNLTSMTIFKIVSPETTASEACGCVHDFSIAIMTQTVSDGN